MKFAHFGTMLVRAALLFVLTALVAACGVRGSLKPPPGEKAVTTDRKPASDPEHRSFILDKLIK